MAGKPGRPGKLTYVMMDNCAAEGLRPQSYNLIGYRCQEIYRTRFTNNINKLIQILISNLVNH